MDVNDSWLLSIRIDAFIKAIDNSGERKLGYPLIPGSAKGRQKVLGSEYHIPSLIHPIFHWFNPSMKGTNPLRVLTSWETRVGIESSSPLFRVESPLKKKRLAASSSFWNFSESDCASADFPAPTPLYNQKMLAWLSRRYSSILRISKRIQACGRVESGTRRTFSLLLLIKILIDEPKLHNIPRGIDWAKCDCGVQAEAQVSHDSCCRRPLKRLYIPECILVHQIISIV